MENSYDRLGRIFPARAIFALVSNAMLQVRVSVDPTRFMARMRRVLLDLMYMVYVGTTVVPPNSTLALWTYKRAIGNDGLAYILARYLRTLSDVEYEQVVEMALDVRLFASLGRPIRCSKYSTVNTSLYNICRYYFDNGDVYLYEALKNVGIDLGVSMQEAGLSIGGPFLSSMRVLRGHATSVEHEKLIKMYEEKALVL